MVLVYNTVLIILTIWAFILGWKKGFSKQHYLFYYLFITFIVDFILQTKIVLNNLPTFNGTYYKYYSIFCINFFAFFYSFVFKKKRRIILLIITLLINVGLIYTVDFVSSTFESQLSISLPVFYILLSLMWFQLKLTQNIEEKIADDAYFWISSGLLIWSGFFLFRIIPAKYLFENDFEFNRLLKSINYITGTIMYLMFFAALLKFRKKEKRNDLSK